MINQQMFIEKIMNIRPFRNMNTIKNNKAIIAFTLAKNIPLAINYFQKHLNRIPELYIIDNLDKNDIFDTFREVTDFKIYTAINKIDFFDKEIVAFCKSTEMPWDEYGYFHTCDVCSKIAPVLSIVTDNGNIQNSFYFYKNYKEYFLKNIDSLINIYNLLEDEESKYILLCSIKHRLTSDETYLPISGYNQYWHPVVHPTKNDVVCEGGAMDGRTTKTISEVIGSQGTIYTFEPNDYWYNITSQYSSKNIIIENKGLWSKNTTLYFMASNSGDSKIIEKPLEESISIQTTSIDEYFFGINKICNYIKLDIEGSELEALKGAKNIIKQYSPKLAISIYHNPYEQFIDIINYIIQLNPKYKLYLGHHSPSFVETVLYAHI